MAGRSQLSQAPSKALARADQKYYVLVRFAFASVQSARDAGDSELQQCLVTCMVFEGYHVPDEPRVMQLVRCIIFSRKEGHTSVGSPLTVGRITYAC